MGRTVNPLSFDFEGSNPSPPTSQVVLLTHFIIGLHHPSTLPRGSSSVGRAIAFQAIGREFEPRLPLHCQERKSFGNSLLINQKALDDSLNHARHEDWRSRRCSSAGRALPW